MRREEMGMMRVPKFLLMGTLFVAVAGFVVMSLWNGLMPAIFGLQSIGFWQAVGLLILSKILFGGFRGGGPGQHMKWRRGLSEKWEGMAPDEREKFRQGMQGPCGSFRPPMAEPKL
jgi:hypothetical protein